MANKFAELQVEDEPDDGEVAIVYDIATYPSDYTLSGIVQMWKDKDIQIPDFQREFVWSIGQSSLLIDSFLCGLPVPPVFFYIDEANKNLVIDGQQRILSVVFYMDGYFGAETTQGKRQVFRLTGLDGRNPFANKRFEELDEQSQRKLKQSVLRAVNIRQLNPPEEGTSAYHIFERLNTGGTPLKPQEIRNCVFKGALNQSLKEANRDKNWRKILGKGSLDKHQKDVEIVLRLFALVGAHQSYEKPMKEYLNKTMRKYGDGSSKRAEKFFALFPMVTALVAETLGERPFHIRGPLNSSVLDAVMVVLMENYGNIQRGELAHRYRKLKDEPSFRQVTQIATTDDKVLRERLSLASKVLLR